MPRLDVSVRFWRFALLILLALAPAACADKAERYARHVARGQELVKEGKDTKAVLEFKTALQSNPAGTEANYQLGLIAERLGDWPSARAFFTKVTDQDTKHVPSLIEEGRIDLMVNNADGALETGTSAVALAPGNALAHALRAAALLRKDQFAESEREASASLKIADKNSAAVAVVAGIRARQGLPDQALAVLDDGIKANPRDAGLKLTRLAVLDSQGNQPEAVATARMLVASEPKLAAYRVDLARRLIAEKQIDAAEAILREGVKVGPSDTGMELALAGFLRQYRGGAAAERELAARTESQPKEFTYKFLLADLYFSDKKEDQARQILQAIVSKEDTNKNGLTARIALARYAIANGKIEDAKGLLKEVLKTDSVNSDALLLRANLAVAAADYPAAIIDLRNALKNNPNLKPVLVALSRTYGLSGETELAADLYQRALDADPADLALRVEYAQQRAASGNPKEADDQLRLVLASEPNFGPALLVRGNLRASQQNWAGAEADAKALISNTAFAAQGHQLLGEILVASKDFGNGITELKQALTLAPQSFKTERLLTMAYASSGDVAVATQRVLSLIAARPNDAEVYALMGELKARLGSLPEAKAAYEHSLSLDPASVNVRLELGYLLTSNGDYPSAARVFAEGTKINPKSVDLQFASAYAEDRLDHFDAARAAYEAVLKLEPRNAAASNNLAGLIADAWPMNKALLEQARRLTESNRNSTNPALIDTIGWVQLRLGNVDDGLALLQSASAAAPKEPQIRYHLGIALLKAGFADKAHSELELAVANNASYRGIDEARKALVSD